MTDAASPVKEPQRRIAWPVVAIAIVIAAIWGFIYNLNQLAETAPGAGGDPRKLGYVLGLVIGSSLALAGLVWLGLFVLGKMTKRSVGGLSFLLIFIAAAGPSLALVLYALVSANRG